jgi:hypothetical protein
LISPKIPAHSLKLRLVVMITRRLLLEEPGGVSRHVRLTARVSNRRKRGVQHDVINDNEAEFVFIEIEGSAAPNRRPMPLSIMCSLCSRLHVFSS